MIGFTNDTGCRFQISHLSSCAAMGQMKEALELINEAVKQNPKLNYDTYPYNAFSARIGTAVFDEGCFEAWGKTYSDLYMPSGKYANQFCTKETFEELRRDDPGRYLVAFAMNEDEIAAAIANPASTSPPMVLRMTRSPSNSLFSSTDTSRGISCSYFVAFCPSGSR